MSLTLFEGISGWDVFSNLNVIERHHFSRIFSRTGFEKGHFIPLFAHILHVPINIESGEKFEQGPCS